MAPLKDFTKLPSKVLRPLSEENLRDSSKGGKKTKEKQEWKLLPKGWYDCEIIDFDIRESKSSKYEGTPYINLVIQVDPKGRQGKENGRRRIWHSLFPFHGPWGEKGFIDFLRNLGMVPELIEKFEINKNLPMILGKRIKVLVSKEEYNGKEKNSVDAFAPPAIENAIADLESESVEY